MINVGDGMKVLVQWRLENEERLYYQLD